MKQTWKGFAVVRRGKEPRILKNTFSRKKENSLKKYYNFLTDTADTHQGAKFECLEVKLTLETVKKEE